MMNSKQIIFFYAFMISKMVIGQQCSFSVTKHPTKPGVLIEWETKQVSSAATASIYRMQPNVADKLLDKISILAIHQYADDKGSTQGLNYRVVLNDHGKEILCNKVPVLKKEDNIRPIDPETILSISSGKKQSEFTQHAIYSLTPIETKVKAGTAVKVRIGYLNNPTGFEEIQYGLWIGDHIYSVEGDEDDSDAQWVRIPMLKNDFNAKKYRIVCFKGKEIVGVSPEIEVEVL